MRLILHNPTIVRGLRGRASTVLAMREHTRRGSAGCGGQMVELVFTSIPILRRFLETLGEAVETLVDEWQTEYDASTPVATHLQAEGGRGEGSDPTPTPESLPSPLHPGTTLWDLGMLDNPFDQHPVQRPRSPLSRRR